MDDLDQIRALLPEPAPPSPAAVARARARLVEVSSDDVAAIPLPRSPLRRPALRRRLVVAVAAAAVAAAGAGTLPLLRDTGAGTGTSTGTAVAGRTDEPSTAEPRSARDVLLVAAEQAGADAAGHGRFWKVRTLTGSAAVTVGTPPNTYRLERRTVAEYWSASDAPDRDWAGGRDLGVRPASPADERAWQADGAPTRWDLGPDPELNGRHRVLSSGPDEGYVVERGPAEQWSDGGPTVHEMRGLPADVAGLRAALAARKPAELHRSDEAWLFGAATDLLAGTPVSPRVRAAAFRLIAELGGVQSDGTVTDPLGRAGTGVTFVEPGPGGSSLMTELVIDTASGQLLSATRTSSVGDRAVKRSYTAVLSAGWTDDAPTVPSATVP